ncbi:MAG: hypothetical protein KBT21_07550 [Treponema sp.]|nr:hypothetical protein [Candidatus Treponema merdequi]
MINYRNYTTEEIDLLYSIIEESVKSKKPICLMKIQGIIKTGDFYLYGSAAGGFVFQFNGLKWIEDGKIYNCLIQPQIRYKDCLPIWVPVITYNDRNHMSSGCLSMIKKENRYFPA